MSDGAGAEIALAEVAVGLYTEGEADFFARLINGIMTVATGDATMQATHSSEMQQKQSAVLLESVHSVLPKQICNLLR